MAVGLSVYTALAEGKIQRVLRIGNGRSTAKRTVDLTRIVDGTAVSVGHRTAEVVQRSGGKRRLQSVVLGETSVGDGAAQRLAAVDAEISGLGWVGTGRAAA